MKYFKKVSLVLFIFIFALNLSAQVVTKTIDNYGVKFIVAEKVPEKLLFLMGSYSSNEKSSSLNLKADGTGSSDGKTFKYWFECNENNFVSKKPFLDETNNPFNNFTSSSNDYDYNIINIIIEYSDHNYKNSLWVSHILINFKLKKAIIIDYDKYIKTIDSNEIDFNTITLVSPIAPNKFEAKSLGDSIAAKEKPTGTIAENFDWAFETRILNMAGIAFKDAHTDASMKILNDFWNKYKTRFSHWSTSFNIENGNILKFAITQNFTPFLETIVSTYQLDINFIDPADNRNVVDYVNDELEIAITSQGATHPRVKVLKEYKQLLEDLGGKPSK